MDLCDLTDYIDEDTTVDFHVTVTRLSGPDTPSYFNVSVLHNPDTDIVTGAAEPGDPCSPGSIDPCCSIVGDGQDGATAPSATIDSAGYPEHGMLVTEIRPIFVSADDRDRQYLECGDPLGPDPCDPTNVKAVKQFCDTVDYHWELVHSPGQTGDGTFVREGRTALFQATAPGNITIKVTVGSSRDPDPVILTRTIAIYDLFFIDQANNRLPSLPLRYLGQTSSQKEGILISRKTISTADDLNGCGASSSYDGPTPSTPDAFVAGSSSTAVQPSGTFRFEIDPGDANLQGLAVRVRAIRPGQIAAIIDQTHQTILGNGRARSAEHLRLVSNASPLQVNLDPNSVYDDELCTQNPSQSLLVKPGDWIVGSLLTNAINGELVGSIEQPVGRVWSESAGPNTPIPLNPLILLEDTIRWYPTAGNGEFFSEAILDPNGPQPWSVAARTQTDQMSEDWAQAGLRFSFAGVTQAGPFANALYVRDPPNHQSGVLTITTTRDTSQIIIAAVTLTPGQSAQEIADAIAAAFQQQGLPSFTARQRILTDNRVLVIADRMHNVMFTIDIGTTGLLIGIPAQDWNDRFLSLTEAHILGLNVRQFATGTLAPTDYEIIVVPDIDVFASGLAGATFVSAFDNSGDMIGLKYCSIVRVEAADGYDIDDPTTASHEAAHYYMDIDGSGHVPEQQNLMFPNDGIESAERRRRLLIDQITDARALPSALAPWTTQIPRRLVE